MNEGCESSGPAVFGRTCDQDQPAPLRGYLLELWRQSQGLQGPRTVSDRAKAPLQAGLVPRDAGSNPSRVSEIEREDNVPPAFELVALRRREQRKQHLSDVLVRKRSPCRRR